MSRKELRHLLHSWLLPGFDLAIRVYLGAVFIYAGIGKIYQPYDFALNIATYQIVPLQFINLMALILPWIEVTAGMLLILGVATKSQALLIEGMLVMFIVAIAIVLFKHADFSKAHISGLSIEGVELKGLKMQCGCFASEEAEHDLSFGTLFRDLGWFVLGLFPLLGKWNRFSVDSFLRWFPNIKWRRKFMEKNKRNTEE